jgi:hypothetical protein
MGLPLQQVLTEVQVAQVAVVVVVEGQETHPLETQVTAEQVASFFIINS